MAWDDEAEELTLKAVDRLGKDSIDDVWEQVAGDLVRGDDARPAGTEAQSFAGPDALRAYKARLRELLKTH